MMECVDIPYDDDTTSICIHCCGRLGPSIDNKDHKNRGQHSSPSLSTSTSYVSKALLSIFKLNYLKAFDCEAFPCNQKDEESAFLLCNKCNDVLADLYHLYQDFLLLGQIDSVLTKKLNRLDEIIDCHERRSINCDLITISRPKVPHGRGETRDDNVVSNPPTSSSSTNSQFRSKELKIKLNRLPENEFPSTTTATRRTTTQEVKEEEFDDSPSAQETNDGDDDYNPEDWLQVKMEVQDADLETPKIVVLDKNDEVSLQTRKATKSDGNKSSLRQQKDVQHRVSYKIIEPASSSSSTSTATTTSQDNFGNSSNISVDFVDEKRKSRFLKLKKTFPNPCWYCQENEFEKPADCYKHTMEVHFPTWHKNHYTSLVCQRCSKILTNRNNFDLHVQWCEAEIPLGVILPRKPRRKGKRAAKPTEKEATVIGGKKYQCPKCLKFYTKKSFKPHLLTHSDDRPYKCDQCEFSAKSHSSLYTHRKCLHSTSNDAVKCDDCGKHLKNQLGLKTHRKRVHTAEGIQKSKEQEKIRSQKDKERRRANPVSTVCSDCNLDLFHRLALLNHRQTHHGDHMGREFICHECGKHLTSKFSLDNHVKTVHSDARPFVCETCGKSFKTIDSLKHHVDRTHSEEGRLKYNELSRKKNRRRKLIASQLASKIRGQAFGDESSNSSQ